MKQKMLIIEEYGEEQAQYVRELLRKMTEEKLHLQVRLKYYRETLTGKKLDSMADLIKEAGKNKEFIVDVILETDQWKQIKRLYKKINQYSVRLELSVSEQMSGRMVKRYAKKMQLEKLLICCKDYKRFQEAYQVWKSVGVTIEPVGYMLSAQEFKDFFDKWIHDAEAVWLEEIEDLSYSILTGVSSGSCEHHSCMGKYVYLDAEGKLYFCSRKKEAAGMYSMREAYRETLYDETYQAVLQNAIAKRTQCMEQCDMFGLCRGGCPLEEADGIACTEYREKIQFVAGFLGKEISNGFINMENACLRKLYLSLIAYGFRTEER